MGKKINALVIIGIIGFFVFGAHLITNLSRAYLGEHNIWWTPQAMRLSLKDSKDKVEIFFKDQLLDKALA